jgi:hypothetical protein
MWPEVRLWYIVLRESQEPVRVYKLVRRTPDGRLVSAYVERPKLELEYPPGEWVEAKVGYLFSYRDRKDAEAGKGSAHEVWEAEAEGIHPTPDVIPNLWAASERLLEEFWESMWVSQAFGQLTMTGTVLSKRLRLVRRLEGGDDEGVQAGAANA